MAKQDLTSANRTFEVKEIAEAAIAAVLPEVERLIDTQQQDSLHMALQRVVANHPEIVGVDFAYRVGEPYMSRYYVALMSTFSRPVHDPQGRVIAVIGADVPMRELSSMAVQLYDNQQRSLIPVIILQLVGLFVLGFIMYRSIISVRKLSKVSAENWLYHVPQHHQRP